MCCRPRCSFCCIYYTIYTLMFMLMLSIILFWIIISPSSVKFHVTDASLTQFNLTTNNNTLYYNFKVNVTVRNPNNNIIVYYRRITAIAWYKDNDFSWLSLTPFDQGHKNTTFLQAVFEGKSVIKLKPRQLGEYKEETSVGVYNDLAVDFDLRIRAKYGRFKSSRFNPPIVQCRRLRVPLISNGETTPPFGVTKCKSDSFFVDRDAAAGTR
ncbi:NDR1/HIN1-like protein 10 [Cajanus cajan]|uniref:Syntaxin-24 n=1 Tax=Cajanus cajan TaxID=3821 RepID=A0A151S8X4_CAJCA|nr:NDR1/HIN1-like protein 10 [Cajanus cajan]KYP51218.1 Putative syntaxin-24 [Cajanus cajan]